MDETAVLTNCKVKLRVNELRTAKGMNLQTLAREAGVSYATALGYDRDITRYFRRDVLAAMARALEVSVPELFADDNAVLEPQAA